MSLEQQIIDLTRAYNQLREQFDNLVRPEVSGVWIDWFPTIFQVATVTSTIEVARYSLLTSNTVAVMMKSTVTGTGTAGNAISVRTIPTAIQPVNVGDYVTVGAGVVVDGAVRYEASVEASTGNVLFFMPYGTSSRIGTNPSFALAAGDVISLTAVWEIA